MQILILIFFLLFCGSMLQSCDSTDEPTFKTDNPTLNSQDSTIIMELYSSLRLFEERDEDRLWVNRHPNLWKGVSYEYDPQTGMRYVNGLSIIIPGTGDSIPSSIGGLKRLKTFSLIGHLNPQDGYIVPKELFDCPIETLEIHNMEDFREEKWIHTKIPSEIIKVKNTLRNLSIRKCGLIDLPENFSEFNQLDQCDFTGNHLSGKVPDYFGDFKSTAVLYGNQFNEFNWILFIKGKTIPDCRANRIINAIPDEVLENYYDLFKERFFEILGNTAHKDSFWINEYVYEWRKSRGLEL